MSEIWAFTNEQIRVLREQTDTLLAEIGEFEMLIDERTIELTESEIYECSEKQYLEYPL